MMERLALYRSDLPPLPSRMQHLPRDHRGYPVPWFVAFIDGKPDFRVIKDKGIATAWNSKLCWLCGAPMGVYKACVVGPMCGINRITSEPPSHLECAEYAAKACPFLTKPLATRVERGLPEECYTSGVALKRNPGATLIWVTKDIKPFRIHPDKGGGVLFRLGNPTSLTFWCKGRHATRAEVEESVRTGLPKLQELAAMDGPKATAELITWTKAFEALLPAPEFIPKELRDG